MPHAQMIDAALMAQAAALVGRGEIVGYPTETFYGLAADPRNPRAIERIFAAKGRRSEEPLPLIASDLAQVERWFGPLGPRALLLARQFWPGPLTLVLPLPAESFLGHGLPATLTAGGATIAVRVPAHPLARALADAAGGLITSTSANPSGQPAATTADEVRRALGDRVALVIDGGTTPGGAPSTIVDVYTPQPTLIRAGVLPWERVLNSLQ